MSAESETLYYAMLASIAESIKPRDFMTWLLIKDVADSQIEVGRYRRYKNELINEPRRREIETQIHRWKHGTVIDQEKVDLECDQELDGQLDAAEAIGASQERLDAIVTEVRDRFNQEAEAASKQAQRQVELWEKTIITERDLALSLNSWIKPVNQVDELLVAAEERSFAARDALQRHLISLARGVWDDVIDGEIVEASPAPVRERRRRPMTRSVLPAPQDKRPRRKKPGEAA